LGDIVTKWASLHGYAAWVTAAAVPVISLTILMLAAGIFWRLWLSAPIDLFPEPKNDVLPLGALAVVLLGSLALSFFVIRRYGWRSGSRSMPGR
jgi:fluoride ion exporter CrcB/FEX